MKIYKLIVRFLFLFFLPIYIYGNSMNFNDINSLKATAYTESILVTWNDVRSAEKYEIKYSVHENMSNPENKEILYVRHLITELSENTDYYIQVRVQEKGEWSKWSEKIQCKTALFSTTVETYNILSSKYDDVFPNQTWNERKEAMGEIITRANNRPDILGIQEGMVKKQVQDIDSMLSNSYDSYIAKKNISGRAIFWKKNKFDLLSYGDDIEVLDSSIKGFKTQRFVTYVKLKEKDTNKILLIFNIHAPSSFSKDNRKIRAIFADNVARKAKKMSKDSGGAPTIILGDFNSSPKPLKMEIPTPAMVLAQNDFLDSYTATKDKVNGYYATHNRITTGVTTSGKNNNNNSKRIDYIFAFPKKDITVSNYNVFIDFQENSGMYLKRPIPSDHRPVRATFHIR